MLTEYEYKRYTVFNFMKQTEILNFLVHSLYIFLSAIPLFKFC